MEKLQNYEHVRIIKTRIESDLGVEKLGKQIGRSSKTIRTQINMYNNMIHAVDAVGEYDKCARVDQSMRKQ